MTNTATTPAKALMIYRGELVTGREAMLRILLRDLIYEKVIAGPCVPGFHGDVARIVELPTGGLRIDRWKRGIGWIEASKGSIRLDEFMPGACRPASAKDAAWYDIPASELDNVTDFEIELEKHEMSRPRKIYGFLWGTVVSELPSPRHRAKIVGLIKERAWDLAARRVRPGNA